MLTFNSYKMISISEIPTELLYEICKELDPISLYKLGKVNTSLKYKVEDLEKMYWIQYYKDKIYNLNSQQDVYELDFCQRIDIEKFIPFETFGWYDVTVRITGKFYNSVYTYYYDIIKMEIKVTLPDEDEDNFYFEIPFYNNQKSGTARFIDRKTDPIFRKERIFNYKDDLLNGSYLIKGSYNQIHYEANYVNGYQLGIAYTYTGPWYETDFFGKIKYLSKSENFHEYNSYFDSEDNYITTTTYYS